MPCPRCAAPSGRPARTTVRLRARLGRSGVQAIYANDNYGVWRSDFHGLIRRCRAAGGASAAITRLLAPRRDDIAVVKSRHSAFYETPVATPAAAIESARTHHHRRFDRVVRTVHRNGCVRTRLPLACAAGLCGERVPRAPRSGGCIHGRNPRCGRCVQARLLPAHAEERVSEPPSSGNDASPMRPRCRPRKPLPLAAN